MDFKPFIFVASSDEARLQAIRETLGEAFDLNLFQSAAECKAAMIQHPPAALVLDTHLSEGDGFALHQDLKDDFDTSDVYQLLLCTPEQACDAGMVADDFLLKPCSTDALVAKLRLLAKLLDGKRAAREQMSYAQNVAMTAMSSMGELGIVMEFMSKSFAGRTIQAVGALALAAIEQYDLDGIIYFSWEGESYVARTRNEPVDPEDREHILQLRTLGRLLQINEQLVVNYDHTTILIRQMPDDAARSGRIRDHIATLCEGVESRIAGLLLENDNVLKQQGIRYAVCEIRDSVANLYEREMAHLNAGRELIAKVTNDFEDAFMHMGMLPEIENQMISQLVALRQKISDIWTQPSEVELKLRSVIHSLETLAGDVGAPSVSAADGLTSDV